MQISKINTISRITIFLTFYRPKNNRTFFKCTPNIYENTLPTISPRTTNFSCHSWHLCFICPNKNNVLFQSTYTESECNTCFWYVIYSKEIIHARSQMYLTARDLYTTSLWPCSIPKPFYYDCRTPRTDNTMSVSSSTTNRYYDKTYKTILRKRRLN